MPDFLDEFASSINTRRDVLRERILKGTPNLLRDSFDKYFASHWIPINDTKTLNVKPSEIHVMAVDSSVYTNLLSTGGIFYLIRSLAICRERQQKCLETDVLFTKASFLDSQRFIGRKMEMIEFQAAINAVKREGKCGTILMDGSLYGRASHLPVETDIEDHRLDLLDYFRVYGELFDLCRKEGITLIGVSKESRSTFYRDFLLKLVFNEALENLKEIDPLDIQKIKPLFAEILDREEQALSKFEKIQNKYGQKLESIRLIFNELRSSRPDYQLIMNHAKTPGYTRPLLVGPSERLARRFEQYWKAPTKYLRANFRNTIREKGESFLTGSSETLSKIMGFPGIVSFHLLLDIRDSPIRIDMPFWDYTFAKTGWPKPIDINIEDVLKIMVTGYCGLDCYNLWLKNVDERVRLKKRVVDTLYFPLMERLFDAKIIRGRGYRRVKYP